MAGFGAGLIGTAVGVAVFGPLYGAIVGFGVGVAIGAIVYGAVGLAGLEDFDPLSPLILDLDGDGIETDALTYFDHEGDGWNELSRWADEDDGVLVWDRNADGVINDGSELFGNNTVLGDGAKADNGFAALSELDDSGDGVVDELDAAWSELRVMRWADANEDGMVQDSERTLVTLSSLGIKSLGTGYAASDHVDGSGNEHRQEGSYTKTDGTVAKLTDVWFVASAGEMTYDKSGIPLYSEEIKGLPDIGGGGRVYDLRDAMALDDAVDADGNSLLIAPYYRNSRTEERSLRELVEAFVEVDSAGVLVLDRSGRELLAEQILLRWTGAEGAVVTDYGWGGWSDRRQLPYADARQLAVMEAFQGGKWLEGRSYRSPAYKTGQKVQRGYQSHLERLYGRLMLESHMRDLHGALSVKGVEGAAEGSVDPEITCWTSVVWRRS